MPDIKMCKNDKCHAHYRCYRFTAKPSKFRQTYFDTETMHVRSGNACLFLIEIEEKPLGFVKEAINTANASWWEFTKAKWFGTQWLKFDRVTDEWVMGYTHKGKSYLSDRKQDARY